MLASVKKCSSLSNGLNGIRAKSRIIKAEAMNGHTGAEEITMLRLQEKPSSIRVSFEIGSQTDRLAQGKNKAAEKNMKVKRLWAKLTYVTTRGMMV